MNLCDKIREEIVKMGFSTISDTPLDPDKNEIISWTFCKEVYVAGIKDECSFIYMKRDNIDSEWKVYVPDTIKIEPNIENRWIVCSLANKQGAYPMQWDGFESYSLKQEKEILEGVSNILRQIKLHYVEEQKRKIENDFN